MQAPSQQCLLLYYKIIRIYNAIISTRAKRINLAEVTLDAGAKQAVLITLLQDHKNLQCDNYNKGHFDVQEKATLLNENKNVQLQLIKPVSRQCSSLAHKHKHKPKKLRSK